MTSARNLRAAATLWLDRRSTTETACKLLFLAQPNDLSGVDVRVYAERVAHAHQRFADCLLDELIARHVTAFVVLDSERNDAPDAPALGEMLRGAAAERSFEGLRLLRHSEWVAEGLANVP